MIKESERIHTRVKQEQNDLWIKLAMMTEDFLIICEEENFLFSSVYSFFQNKQKEDCFIIAL
jgi:hypothetical protein